MKKIILTFGLIGSLLFNLQANNDPCGCGLPVETIMAEGPTFNALLSYIKWTIHVQEQQRSAAEATLSNENITGEERSKLENARAKFIATIGKLNGIKKRAIRAGKMTQAQYTGFILEASRTNNDGLKSAYFFWKKKRKPGSGDCGTEYQRPDCSSEAQNVNTECARGVNIMAGCGFYTENGGAEAMQTDLEACGMASQNMMNMCMSAVAMCQPFRGDMVRRNYEADAYSVCGQMENDKMNMAPGQTQTSTGN